MTTTYLFILQQCMNYKGNTLVRIENTTKFYIGLWLGKTLQNYARKS